MELELLFKRLLYMQAGATTLGAWFSFVFSLVRRTASRPRSEDLLVIWRRSKMHSGVWQWRSLFVGTSTSKWTLYLMGSLFRKDQIGVMCVLLLDLVNNLAAAFRMICRQFRDNMPRQVKRELQQSSREDTKAGIILSSSSRDTADPSFVIFLDHPDFKQWFHVAFIVWSKKKSNTLFLFFLNYTV